MELSSSRSSAVERVLGQNGHLSNDQAALFVKEILLASKPGRLQHMVSHLGRDCNPPEPAGCLSSSNP